MTAATVAKRRLSKRAGDDENTDGRSNGGDGGGTGTVVERLPQSGSAPRCRSRTRCRRT